MPDVHDALNTPNDYVHDALNTPRVHDALNTDTYLNMFVGNQVTIDEPLGDFVVGVGATVGEDTFIGGTPAYFFRVRIAYGYGSAPFDINEWKNIHIGTRAIVDLEKPAHTYYTLDARTPGFVVAHRSTVARDTLIWERSQPFS